jgi:hypothetical protein
MLETVLAVDILSVVVVPCVVWPMGRSRLRQMARCCWPLVRPPLGWLFIVLGGLGLVLPGPGILFLVVGMGLLGRRHPLLRRIAVLIKLRLRTWAQRAGWRGSVARRGQRLLREQRSYAEHMSAWLSAWGLWRREG